MRKVELLDQRFGHLRVLSEASRRCRTVSGKQRSEVFWLCQCDCGSKVEVSARQLLCKMSVSCGQVSCEYHNPLKHADAREGSIRYLFDNYKQNARKRGYAFNITLEQFRALTSQDCKYCGVMPSSSYLKSWKGIRPETTKNQPYTYNGIDRVDNSVGYEIENCAPCCKVCNIMKQGLTEKEFWNHISQIWRRRP